MNGWRVPGFTTVRELGEGGQGAVVLARHDTAGTLVAIKYVASDADRAVLRHEAAMLGRTGSPHVARLFQLVETDEGAAIVMEAVDGVPLRTVLQREGALAPEAALAILKGSLLGLAAAHELGVVHRDYKPANVVVPPDGRSKLIDFGIAVTAGRESGGAGTPAYMAPEQWRRGVATPATDVYAATCVFFECVAGRRPFSGSLPVLENAHLNEPPPVEAVPEALRPLVGHGMAKDPALRPPSAADFVTELEAVASAAYGPDWERRGVRALAASAAALASLFPIAALVGSSGGAAGAGAGVGAGAGAGAGGAASTAAGTSAAGTSAAGTSAAGTSAAGTSAAGTSAAGTSAAGTSAAATASQGLLASTTAKVAVGVVATALVAGGAATARHYVASPSPKPRAKSSAAPSPTATVQLIASHQCKVTDPFGGDQTPKGAPPKVRTGVRLPAGATVYRFAQGEYVVGPAGQDCSRSIGNSSASTTIGRGAAAGGVSTYSPFSIGSFNISTCLYFPDSPEAAKIRRSGECTSDLRVRRPLDLGRPSPKMVVGLNPGTTEAAPPSPYVSVVLGIMNGGSLTCRLPQAQAEVCVAALTFGVERATAKKPLPPAALVRVQRQIADAVAASKR
ncbi:serine/threonine-protein kinase [Actinomadura oligospora]|uniref:serine/threonine-protein kinase n=1 Tax=Actinomadura oligospora TaxID=111804 RepID=UPI0004AE1170|nr:serine/threonine-protein kinase [Actinomadura oligospora]